MELSPPEWGESGEAKQGGTNKKEKGLTTHGKEEEVEDLEQTYPMAW